MDDPPHPFLRDLWQTATCLMGVHVRCAFHVGVLMEQIGPSSSFLFHLGSLEVAVCLSWLEERRATHSDTF